MKETKKKTRKEPVFLLEMPQHISQIVLKRGHLLRSNRTRSLCALSKRGQKAWLQAALTPESGQSKEESWDKAHELAGKFERELHADIYVEPGSKAGRYNSVIAPTEGSVGSENSGETSHQLQAHSGPGIGFDNGFSSGHGFVSGVSGIGGSFGSASKNPLGFSSGMGSGTNLPKTGSFGPSYGLPPEVEAMMAKTAAASTEVTCPALYELCGWDKISANKQLMFEVEAAQSIKAGLTLEAEQSEQLAAGQRRSTLELLMLQPKLSKALKRFLEEALGKTQAA